MTSSSTLLTIQEIVNLSAESPVDVKDVDGQWCDAKIISGVLKSEDGKELVQVRFLFGDSDDDENIGLVEQRIAHPGTMAFGNKCTYHHLWCHIPNKRIMRFAGVLPHEITTNKSLMDTFSSLHLLHPLSSGNIGEIYQGSFNLLQHKRVVVFRNKKLWFWGQLVSQVRESNLYWYILGVDQFGLHHFLPVGKNDDNFLGELCLAADITLERSMFKLFQ